MQEKCFIMRGFAHLLCIVWGLWCREYLLEVKVRLLEQLSCGFNSPQLAIEFIQMLLDEYSILCMALPTLLYLLEPLVSFLLLFPVYVGC